MIRATDTAVRRPPHVPGEAGVWVFIMGDMWVFALFFTTFIYYRAQDVALYTSAQQHLNQSLGAFNTFLLLTSSWFVIHAVEASRAARAALSRRLLLGALLCGAGFVAVKYFEYSEKIHAGLTIASNEFFMFYYVLTGIHLLHVAIGMLVLVYLWQASRSASRNGAELDISLLEGGASFWHMVDILWIVLFALIYMTR